MDWGFDCGDGDVPGAGAESYADAGAGFGGGAGVGGGSACLGGGCRLSWAGAKRAYPRGSSPFLPIWQRDPRLKPWGTWKPKRMAKFPVGRGPGLKPWRT